MSKAKPRRAAQIKATATPARYADAADRLDRALHRFRNSDVKGAWPAMAHALAVECGDATICDAVKLHTAACALCDDKAKCEHTQAAASIAAFVLGAFIARARPATAYDADARTSATGLHKALAKDLALSVEADAARSRLDLWPGPRAGSFAAWHGRLTVEPKVTADDKVKAARPCVSHAATSPLAAPSEMVEAVICALLPLYADDVEADVSTLAQWSALLPLLGHYTVADAAYLWSALVLAINVGSVDERETPARYVALTSATDVLRSFVVDAHASGKACAGLRGWLADNRADELGDDQGRDLIAMLRRDASDAADDWRAGETFARGDRWADSRMLKSHGWLAD